MSIRASCIIHNWAILGLTLQYCLVYSDYRSKLKARGIMVYHTIRVADCHYYHYAICSCGGQGLSRLWYHGEDHGLPSSAAVEDGRRHIANHAVSAS
jgi:hypothetical protein